MADITAIPGMRIMTGMIGVITGVIVTIGITGAMKATSAADGKAADGAAVMNGTAVAVIHSLTKDTAEGTITADPAWASNRASTIV
jgi:hypothetical protein